jgi:hypothetical protein
MTSEQVWHFHVEDGLQFDKNGTTYFNERATEWAETIGCRLVSMKNVELETVPGGRWMVTGTVSLEKANAHA